MRIDRELRSLSIMPARLCCCLPHLSRSCYRCTIPLANDKILIFYGREGTARNSRDGGICAGRTGRTDRIITIFAVVLASRAAGLMPAGAPCGDVRFCRANALVSRDHGHIPRGANGGHQARRS